MRPGGRFFVPCHWLLGLSYCLTNGIIAPHKTYYPGLMVLGEKFEQSFIDVFHGPSPPFCASRFRLPERNVIPSLRHKNNGVAESARGGLGGNRANSATFL